MTTTVGCRLEIDVVERSRAVLSVAVSQAGVGALTGAPAQELAAHHGTRLHLAQLASGRTTIRYEAQLEPSQVPRAVDPLDEMVALRPSRYCPSDQLAPWALSELAGASVDEVVQWVRDRLTYDPAASRPVDSAVDTLLTGRGVCRDYAHLTIALLRALEVPARFVSVYAPGLWPMDFHAVVEVAQDGVWQLHDATGLAPRPSMVRIATGRDAADTSFLTTTGGEIALPGLEVWASTDGVLPPDGPTALA
jgi:transglutaminase-like putative cysteine protease